MPFPCAAQITSDASNAHPPARLALALRRAAGRWLLTVGLLAASHPLFAADQDPRAAAEASLITQWMLIGAFPSVEETYPVFYAHIKGHDIAYEPEAGVDLSKGCHGSEPVFRWRGVEVAGGAAREGEESAASVADVRAHLLAAGVKAESIERVPGGLVSWKAYVAKEGTASLGGEAPARSVNLSKQFARDDSAVAYAYTRLISDQDRDVSFLIGSDDGLKVWCNGALIHANKVNRGVRMDEDTCKAHLRKGANDVLLKITQGGGGWGFCFRVADESRKPIGDGVRVDVAAK